MSNFVLPSGVVLPFAGPSTNIPDGFLLCDGSTVSRTTYANLYNAVGDAHGNGDGSTTFHLPDYRGRFLRGLDSGAGRDPNAGTRTASNSGGNTGDNVGSVQSDAMQGHKHTLENMSYDNRYAGTGGNMLYNGAGVAVSSPITDGTNGTPRTSSETRPVNSNVIYIIKA